MPCVGASSWQGWRQSWNLVLSDPSSTDSIQNLLSRVGVRAVPVLELPVPFHFTGRETEAQRGMPTCQSSHHTQEAPNQPSGPS